MHYYYSKILPFFLLHAIIYIFFTSYLYADCPPGFNEPKNQYFKILVCGDNNVTSNKLEHAATVLKNIIDFDGDGIADSPEVAKRLYSSGAAYIVLSSELYEEKYVNFSKNMNFTVVYEDEMITDFSEFDPTLEEALHLVTQFGYAEEYPDSFGEFENSEIALLMDIARGGHFKKNPSKYPKKAFYTYYDQTCDYGCQVTEFTYWAITSLRNQQSTNNRFDEIKNEWRLNTRKKIENDFPELLYFFSNPIFGINF